MKHWLKPFFSSWLKPRRDPTAGSHATPVPGNPVQWARAEHWARLRARHDFLAALSDEESARLWRLCDAFIKDKQINAAGKHVLTDEIVTSIAVQACLPVLELGLQAYPDFAEIIVYPGEFMVEREIVDEAGVVHRVREALAGEAWEGGPVVLSWEDASGLPGDWHSNDADLPAGNVVIHEFAHKLDMSNGAVDGLPRFYRSLHAGLDASNWCAVFDAALADFRMRLDDLEERLPRDLDPESDEASAWYAALPLDPYAAEDEGEFFSVCAEAFFVDPHRLAAAYPPLYDLLKCYFRQDPGARLRSSVPQSP